MTQLQVSDTDIAYMALDFISAASSPEKTKERLAEIAAAMAKAAEAQQKVAEDAAFVRRNKNSQAEAEAAQQKLAAERKAYAETRRVAAEKMGDRETAAEELEAGTREKIKELEKSSTALAEDVARNTKWTQSLKDFDAAVQARADAIAGAATALAGEAPGPGPDGEG